LAAAASPAGQVSPQSYGTVRIPLPSPAVWANKTITVRVLVDPIVGLGPSVVVSLETFDKFTNQTGTVDVANGGGFHQGWAYVKGTIVGADATAIRIRAGSGAGYTGKLYIDEIEVK